MLKQHGNQDLKFVLLLSLSVLVPAFLASCLNITVGSGFIGCM